MERGYLLYYKMQDNVNYFLIQQAQGYLTYKVLQLGAHALHQTPRA
jgi:hypothetical protein